MGLIVNPIAGMGGSVGLKGTDGPDVVDAARSLGAEPQASLKAVRALNRLSAIAQRLAIVTCPDEMGEIATRSAGLSAEVLGLQGHGPTGPDDTRAAAREMLRRGVDLLLFAGGDGTARDIVDVIGQGVPALGIPAGVKIHSGAFATTPENAGNLAALFLTGKPTVPLTEAEVMDIDEAAVRQGRLSASLHGYLRVPSAPLWVQGPKSSAFREEDTIAGIASRVAGAMEPECLYVIGPGTTTRAITRHLGLDGSLLGVDIVCNRQILGKDLGESQILAWLETGQPARIVVGVVGGQGYIFGRGNQQISPRVIRRVGRDRVTVVATPGKLLTLSRGALLVDTGDPQLDRDLQGYVRVVTGSNEETLFRVLS